MHISKCCKLHLNKSTIHNHNIVYRRRIACNPLILFEISSAPYTGALEAVAPNRIARHST